MSINAILDQEDSPYGDIATERRVHAERSEQAALWLLSQPERVREQLRNFQVRCPTRGCRLADVYRIAMRNGGERYVVLSRTTSAGSRHQAILNWAFSDDWAGLPVYVPSGCRHGSARLGLGWLLDCAGLIQGWHHAMETVEAARAKAPDYMQRGIRRRIFHPEPNVWRQAA